MEQLDKWQKELKLLNAKRFKQTDSELFEVYRKSLIDIKKRLYDYTQAYDQLSFSSRLEVERYFKVAKEIDDILTAVYPDVETTIKSYSANQAKMGYNGTWYTLEQSQQVVLDMPLINQEYINKLVNQPVAGKRLSKRLYQQRDKLAKNVTNNIVEGLFSGDGYAKIAKRVADQTEATYKQALRIAITEGGRTQSETTQKSSENAKKLGIDMQKRWMATLDSRTREDHQHLDGQTVEIEDDFTSGIHKAKGPRLFGVAALDIWCRCTTINIVNGIAPELRRDNKTGEYIEYVNYDEWLANKKSDGKEKDNNQLKEIVEKIKVNETIKNNLQKEINLEKEIEELSKTPKNVDYKKEHRRLREALEEQYDDGEIDDDEYNAGLAELRERFKRSNLTGDMKDNSDKMISLKNQLLELQESNAIKNADIIKSELAKYREMGVPSDVDMKKHLTKPNSRASKVIAKAYDYYPTDWVRKSAEHGIIDVGTAKRGYYSAGFKELRLSGARGKHSSFRTALHELGHRMEDVDKAISERERQFYEYRTKGETLQSLKKLKGGNYKENEMTRVDNFLHPYMGKDYDGDFYEVLTMGIDTLYTRPTELMKDPEMFEWVVGMLLK